MEKKNGDIMPPAFLAVLAFQLLSATTPLI
jgi:hypothetical protein